MASKKKHLVTETQMKQIIAMRNNKVHMSSIMLMHIINKITTQTGSAYLGEIRAYYLEMSKNKQCRGFISYTESGIRTHLYVMKSKGYITVTKEGPYNKYAVTLKGLMSIRGLF